MTHDAVLFDLDGTLLNTLEDLAESMNRSLARLGHPAHGVDAYRYFVGDGVVNLARRALPPSARDEATVRACVKAMEVEYAVRWAEKTRPYPGVPELLDALSGRGVRMAVLSNKPDRFTRLMVAELLPHWRFAAVCGATPETARKPDPAAALAIAAAVGSPPEKFLYVGDTDTDMKTAVAAGMLPVGAAWGFRPVQELLDNGAVEIIHSPPDLLKLL